MSPKRRVYIMSDSNSVDHRSEDLAFEGNFESFFKRNSSDPDIPPQGQGHSPSRRHVDRNTGKTVEYWRKKMEGGGVLTEERLKSWDSIMALLIFFTATVTIYEISFLDVELNVMFGINRLVDLCFLIDIALSFRRPFYKNHIANYDRRTIAKNYVRGWFLIDCVSAIPGDAFSLGMDTEDDLTLLRLLKVLKLLKLFRILKGYQAILMIAARLNIQHATVQIFGFLLIVLLYIHWLGCMMHMLPDFEGTGCGEEFLTMWEGEEGWSQTGEGKTNWIAAAGLCRKSEANRWLGSLELAFGTMGMGYGWIYPYTGMERLFCLLSMMIGGMLHAFAIGSFCTVLSTHDPATIDFNSKHDLLLRYMDEHHFPSALKNRVKSYYAYTRGIIRDKTYIDLQSNMTPKLQFDVARHCHKRWLKDLPLFRASNRIEADAFIGAVAVKMVSVAYPPREVIFVKGEFALAMYVITRGLVHCCDPDLGGARLNVSGFLFGEEILLTRGVRYDTACSLSYVNLLSLSRTDLEEILHMGGEAFKSTKKCLRRTAVKLAMRRAMKEIAVSNRIIKGFKRSQAIMSNRCRTLYLRFLVSRSKNAETQAKEKAEAEEAARCHAMAAAATMELEKAGDQGLMMGGVKETTEMVYYDKDALDPLSNSRSGSKPELERRPSEVDAAAKAAAAIQESELARGGVVEGDGSARTSGRRRMSHMRIPMSIKGLSPNLQGTRRLSGVLQRGMRQVLEDPSSPEYHQQQEQSSMNQWQKQVEEEITPEEVAARTLSRWTLPSAESMAAAQQADSSGGSSSASATLQMKELKNITQQIEQLGAKGGGHIPPPPPPYPQHTHKQPRNVLTQFLP
jgi:potassium voltage-gated channel Eag-related subfamily H protein 7